MLKTSEITNTTIDNTVRKPLGRTRVLILPLGAAVLLSACSGLTQRELTQEAIIIHPTTIANEVDNSAEGVVSSEVFRAVSTVETLPVETLPASTQPNNTEPTAPVPASTTSTTPATTSTTSTTPATTSTTSTTPATTSTTSTTTPVLSPPIIQQYQIGYPVDMMVACVEQGNIGRRVYWSVPGAVMVVIKISTEFTSETLFHDATGEQVFCGAPGDEITLTATGPGGTASATITV